MAKSFFGFIEKYNPYHGRDGRFTGAGGATSFSLTGGANAKRSEMLRTWSNAERDSAIGSIAKETRFLKNEQYRIIGENGKTLLQSQGEQDNVKTSVGDKREFLGGNTSIHNHPDGGTFSAVDLRDFGFGAKEIIVVSPEGDYSLKNTNMGNKKQFDGWLDMQEALKRDVKEASPFELKAKAKENLSNSAEKKEIDSITSEWVKIKDSNGLESANEWYSGKKDRYDSLVETYNKNVKKEVRRLEVAPFDEWYKENASKYGFDYSFTPNGETPVKKYNDVHDPKTGRFASKGGGVGDSSGRKLTSAQAEYFKDSKVRDKDGNLLVMYHGTPNGGFEEFRSGTHFTESPEYADHYQSQGASSMGYKKTAENPMTYEVYLDIKKPFDTRNPEEREIFENEYYRKWGMGTPLTGKGLPDWLDAQDLQEFIDEMGYDYDGLILDEGGTGGYGEAVKDRGISYVVFNANQVKSVTNENPTDDGRISKSFLDVVYKYNHVHDPKTGQFASAGVTVSSEVDAELLRLHNAGGRFTASKYAKEHGIDYNEWKKQNGFSSEHKKQTAEEREKLDSQREHLKEVKAQQEKESEKRDYMMAHRPSKFGAGYDLTSEGAMPKDVYDHPEYYFNMREQSSKESMRALNSIRNKPDKEVTIYRASPKNEFNDGDWVTLSRTYAKEHAERVGGNVYSKVVRAKDIQFAGDDVNEFGYFPETIAKSFISMVRKMNIWHDPRTGRFTSGSGGTMAPDRGTGNGGKPNKNERKALTNRPKRANVNSESGIGLSPKGKNELSVFKDNILDDHFDRHGHEFQGMTKDEYKTRALELINSQVGGTVFGYQHPTTNQIVRFDILTGEFVKGNRDSVVTFFKAKHPKEEEMNAGAVYNAKNAFRYFIGQVAADHGYYLDEKKEVRDFERARNESNLWKLNDFERGEFHGYKLADDLSSLR